MVSTLPCRRVLVFLSRLYRATSESAACHICLVLVLTLLLTDEALPGVDELVGLRSVRLDPFVVDDGFRCQVPPDALLSVVCVVVTGAKL
jgi:hypothetical protein